MSLQQQMELIYKQRQASKQQPRTIILKGVAIQKGELNKLNSNKNNVFMAM